MPANPYNYNNTTPDHLSGPRVGAVLPSNGRRGTTTIGPLRRPYNIQNSTGDRAWNSSSGDNSAFFFNPNASQQTLEQQAMRTALDDSANQNPWGGVKTSGGGGGGGGAGGGMMPIDWGALGKVWGNKPKQFAWQDFEHTDYVPSKFRDFDDAKYEQLRQGLRAAILGDRTAGNAQYAQMGEEIAAYQNPWSDPTPQTTNPAMSESMRRMMQANGTPTDINMADTNRGIQADQAFGNLLSVLGMAADQEQQSRMRSNAGYQRNLNERLDAEQRGGELMVGMSEAKARELYEQEKWQFGEQIAQMNYQARREAAQYNNQGQNQTAQGNAQMVNDFYANREGALTDLIASGQVPPEVAIAQAFNLDPGLKAAMAALAGGGA